MAELLKSTFPYLIDKLTGDAPEGGESFYVGIATEIIQEVLEFQADHPEFNDPTKATIEQFLDHIKKLKKHFEGSSPLEQAKKETLYLQLDTYLDQPPFSTHIATPAYDQTSSSS